MREPADVAGHISVSPKASEAEGIDIRAPKHVPDGEQGIRLELEVAGRASVSLDDFYAHMPSHQYIFTPSGEFWPAASINARIPPQMVLDANGEPIMSEGGGVKTIPAAAWLDRERPVEQMTWAPGEGYVIKDRLISDGGWIRRPGCTCFNLYRPPTLQSGDATAAQPWLDHVNRIYPAEADHLINWLAHRVQRPEEKVNHAIVLGGAQGIGKDTLLEPVKYAIGPWNFAEVSPQHMLGRFNGFVKSVILRISEARDLGDIDRFTFYDHMKTYTAAPPNVLRVDEKHRQEYAVFNVCGVIITTNHKTDGIYLPPDDRRHFVAWSPLTKDDLSEDYWTGLWRWFEAGGFRHVTAYLRTLDLSGFNPKAPPRRTEGFMAIVDSNRAPEDAELADALEQLGNPAVTTIESIANSTTSETFRGWLRDRRNSRQVPHRLEECGYERVRSPSASDGLWKFPAGRAAIYARRDLTPREQIAAAQSLVCNTRR